MRPAQNCLGSDRTNNLNSIIDCTNSYDYFVQINVMEAARWKRRPCVGTARGQKGGRQTATPGRVAGVGRSWRLDNANTTRRTCAASSASGFRLAVVRLRNPRVGHSPVSIDLRGKRKRHSAGRSERASHRVSRSRSRERYRFNPRPLCSDRTSRKGAISKNQHTLVDINDRERIDYVKSTSLPVYFSGKGPGKLFWL